MGEKVSQQCEDDTTYLSEDSWVKLNNILDTQTKEITPAMKILMSKRSCELRSVDYMDSVFIEA